MIQAIANIIDDIRLWIVASLLAIALTCAWVLPHELSERIINSIVSGLLGIAVGKATGNGNTIQKRDDGQK